MPRVVHFELPADDPERAASFYSDVFGWKVSKMEAGGQPYWLVMTGEEGEPGINGGILQRVAPEQTTMNTIDVASVDDALASITARGGTVALPKMAVPGVGWLAYCHDPEGNVFGIMQSDESAS
jgi:uncharacterized protein